MTPFYRCSDGHDEVRWSWVDGRHCWHCGKLGHGSVSYTITSSEEHIRAIDDALMPVHDRA
jgi:hypothetical protein